MAKKKRSKKRAASWANAQNAQPEELRGLAKWLYEDKMGIVPDSYYHEKARRDIVPEGCVNRSRRRQTPKEHYLQQLVDYERNAIETGAKTWAEVPKATQKLMEEWLSEETIANLKAAKKPETDDDCIESRMFDFTPAEILEVFGCATIKELNALLNFMRKQGTIYCWGGCEYDGNYLVYFA